MAFVAISSSVPRARSQWTPAKKGDPNPGGGDGGGGGSKPPYVPPPPKKPHHCTDGHERVRVPLPWGGYGWTCERIKSGQSAAHESMVKQVTGVRQITPISGSDLTDRVVSKKTQSKNSYPTIKGIKTTVNEAINP